MTTRHERRSRRIWYLATRADRDGAVSHFAYAYPDEIDRHIAELLSCGYLITLIPRVEVSLA